MGITTKILRYQKAVYWAYIRPDPTGVPVVAAPVEISVRWTDTQEEYIDKAGATQLSRAKVFVDRVVTLDGYLMLGELGVGTPDDPKTTRGAYMIRKFREVKSINQRKAVRIAYV